jgi:heat shock protein HspQ
VVARDPTCHATDEWYEANRTRPTRDQPWYHVLVDGASHVTYAAQSSLLPDESMRAVEHPLVPFFFRDFADGRYRRNDRTWPTLET